MIRAILGAVLGAAAAAAALLAFTFLDPAVAFDMDRDVQRPLASGLYPAEVAGDGTYAWTSPLTTFTLRDLSRRSAWRCVIRLRGARPPGIPEPEVVVAVDGIALARRAAGPHYEDVDVIAPPREGRGLRLSIASSPPYVPATDTRQLGVQLDRLECAPHDAGWVFPPRKPLLASTLAGGLFGALFGVLGVPMVATLASCVFGLALAFLVQSGIGIFSAPYLDSMTASALGIALPALALGVLTMKRTSGSARFVIAFSAAVLFLKLAALMHPSKALVDALFHAHRLEWVMDGRYFFTQPMPGGVQFPYAIGLYVVALPFTSLAGDYVTLLRTVVCVGEVVGAALLYLVVSKLWRDRLAGVIAVVCYHLVPLPYAVIGNANLTYAFGHGVSVLTFAAVSLLAFRWHNAAGLLVLLLAASVAFLSHVAVFPLLAAALVFTGALYAISRDPELRPQGLPVLAVATAGAMLAFVIYYAHFPEVWGTLDRVRSTAVDASAAEPQAAPQPALAVSTRAVRAVTLGVRDLGIPLIVLAAAGLWLRIRSGSDRLNRVLVAWGAAFVLFVGFRIVAPVDPQLQRYADEFIDRVYYATLPAIVVLAAAATAGGWRAGGVFRVGAAVLFASAAGVGIAAWTNWIR